MTQGLVDEGVYGYERVWLVPRRASVGWRNGEKCVGAAHAVGASRDMPCVMMGCERFGDVGDLRDALAGQREEGGGSVSLGSQGKGKKEVADSGSVRLEAENRLVEMEHG